MNLIFLSKNKYTRIHSRAGLFVSNKHFFFFLIFITSSPMSKILATLTIEENLPGIKTTENDTWLFLLRGSYWVPWGGTRAALKFRESSVLSAQEEVADESKQLFMPERLPRCPHYRILCHHKCCILSITNLR